MPTQPPPFPHPDPIKKGIGKLTPQVWDSLIWCSEWVHENAAVLDKLIKASEKDSKVVRPWFLAKITGAKLAAPNRYKYKWTKVRVDDWTSAPHGYSDDDTLDSQQDGVTAYAYYAVNIIEGGNSNTKTATGTDESAATFPDTLNMQAIGGGYTASIGTETTPYIEPIVQMFVWRDSESVTRYMFSAANSYDGGCEE